MAEVALSGYSELLAAVIRDVPGRTWDKQRREWLVPAAWDRGPGRLAGGNAAVEVRTTEQRMVICPRCPEPVLAGSPVVASHQMAGKHTAPGIAPGAVAFGI